MNSNDNRFVLFPIKHHKIWEMHKMHNEASFWTAEEIDHDLQDWEKLNSNEKQDVFQSNLGLM